MNCRNNPGNFRSRFLVLEAVSLDTRSTDFRDVFRKYSDEVPGDTSIQGPELWLWTAEGKYQRCARVLG